MKQRAKKEPVRSEAEVNALVEANIPLAHFLALKHDWHDEQEALSVSMEGLWMAARFYEESRGIPFGAYAGQMIRWKLTGLHKSRLRKKRGGGVPDLSLNAPTSSQEFGEMGDDLRDDSMPMAWQRECDDDLRALVAGALDTLTDRERDVLRRRFGLHGREASILDTVASEYGLTRERIRQIQEAALKRLRKRLRRSDV